MITLIEALNFRCFKYIRQPLGPFHVLVGPNASGKSAFLDILSFLSDFVNEGLEIAVKKRTDNFYDLVYGREGDSFEIAVEAGYENLEAINPIRRRYEVRFILDWDKNIIKVDKEQLYLLDSGSKVISERSTLIAPENEKYSDRIIRIEKNTKLPKETYQANSHECKTEIVVPINDNYSILKHSLLHNDLDMFTHLFNLSNNLVYKVNFLSDLLKSASPPGTGMKILGNGSNLPWVIEEIKNKYEPFFIDWTSHLQTSLYDLDSIRTVLKPEDRSRYVMLKYKNGIEVPSWIASEGTLRLIALTLLAYVPANNGLYLIEEPENGIHPQAIETVMQSLQSIYDGQVFITTHSPLILNMVKLDQILCFTKDENGVNIVNGKDHPVLKEWRNEVSLGTLFASGVMG